MKYIITTICCLFSFVLMAQTPSVKTNIDKKTIKIGEQLTYTIESENGKSVIFPKVKLQGLEVAKELPVEESGDTRIKKYLITGFDSGAFYIKKQQVFIDSKAFITDSILVNVNTVAVDTLQIKESYNTKVNEEESYTVDEIFFKTQMYIYITIGVALLIVLFYFLLRKKKTTPKKSKPKLPPYVVATQSLETLEEKQLWQNNKVKEYYSELTDIVRKFIGDELRIQALETTTDELMTLLKSENKQQNIGLEKEILERLKGLLSQADFVKFAKQKPIESDIRGHKTDAEAVVDTIHELIEAKKEEEKNELQ